MRDCGWRPILPGLLVASALLAISAVAWATDVGGTITTDTTWSLANSPYVVTSDVYLTGGDTLTIEPGVEVRFNAGKSLNIRGVLNAQGTVGSPIVFTANSGSPFAGFWNRIRFYSTESSASVMDYCTVRWAGSGSHGAIHCENYSSTEIPNPTLRRLTILNSSNYGIFSEGNAPTIQDCTIQNCADCPVLLGTVSYKTGSPDYVGTNTFTGSGINQVCVDDGYLGDGNWESPGGAIRVLGDVLLYSGRTLVIQPGVTIEFAANAHLQSHGTLQAIGTVGEPITFTSYKGVGGAPGDWDCLWFDDDAAAASVLQYVNVRFAGSGGDGSIYLTDSSGPANITIKNATIRDSSNHGIVCDGTAPKIGQTLIQNCANYPLYLFPSASPDYLGGNTFLSNGRNAVGVDGGTWNTTTWEKPVGYPMEIVKDLTIANGQTLTVSPGTTVRLGGGVWINAQGVLKAQGGTLAGQRITFTGFDDAGPPGSWDCIRLYGAGSDTSVLQNCNIKFGGSSGNGAVYVQGTSSAIITPQITGCIISKSSNYGIYSYSAAPVIGGCTLKQLASHPIRIASAGGPTYPTANSYAQNARNTLGVVGGSWGTATWRKPRLSLDYEVLDDVSVSSTKTLTIEPGVIVRMQQSVSMGVSGILDARGTPANRILFTTWRPATPMAGDWAYVSFSGSGSSSSKVEYCTFHSGGRSGSTEYAMLRFDGYFGAGSPPIKNCVVKNSAGDGIYCFNGASPRIDLTQVTNNANIGMRFADSTAVITNCTVKSNKIGVQIESPGNPNLGNFLNVPTNDDGNNNLLGNTEHDLKNLSTNFIKAEHNWWGTNQAAVIASHIWDYQDDNSRGRVDYDPWKASITAAVAAAGTPQVTGMAAAANGAGGASITFTLSAPAAVEAVVLNIAGRPVRAIAHATALQAGANALLWDGRSDAGTKAPAGAYLVRVVAHGADGSQSQALVGLRLGR